MMVVPLCTIYKYAQCSLSQLLLIRPILHGRNMPKNFYSAICAGCTQSKNGYTTAIASGQSIRISVSESCWPLECTGGDQLWFSLELSLEQIWKISKYGLIHFSVTLALSILFYTDDIKSIVLKLCPATPIYFTTVSRALKYRAVPITV